MFMHRGIIFLIGLAVGVAAVFIFREPRTAEIPLRRPNEETVVPSTTPISASADDDRLELLRLRGEVARLRRENSELQRASSEPNTVDHSAPNERRPTFKYPFLNRETWTNVGLATPAAAVQTFFSAFANGDEAVLARASSLQPNGEPFVLTGMSTHWAERVMGVQILSSNFSPKDPDMRAVTILTET